MKYVDFYGGDYSAQTGTRLVSEGEAIDMSKDCAQLIQTTLSETPTDVTRIYEKCDNILYRAIPKLVQAKDEAEFLVVQEQVLKDLEAAGEPEAWEWFSTEFMASKRIMDPIFESVAW